FSRRILPEPVTRKRLPAPEWLLFFGIWMPSLFVVRQPNSWTVRLSSVTGGSDVDVGVEVLGALALLLLGHELALLGRATRALLDGSGLALGDPGVLLGLDVDLGVGLLLVRPDHHGHVATVLLGRRLDEAELLHVLG